MTSIYGETGEREAEGLVELAAVCGLSREDASREVAGILSVTSQWKSAAAKNGCRQTEVQLMGKALAQVQTRLEAAFRL